MGSGSRGKGGSAGSLTGRTPVGQWKGQSRLHSLQALAQKALPLRMLGRALKRGCPPPAPTSARPA